MLRPNIKKRRNWLNWPGRGSCLQLKRDFPEPLVVEPVESIGKYGGTWRRAFTGINDFHAFGRQVYDTILRWPRDPKDPIKPGLAKEWYWSDDGKVLTFALARGIEMVGRTSLHHG